MKHKTLHQAFPIVAAAIGERFGIQVGVGGDQAYTDGKRIQLPAYEGDDPDYQDYAWGLLAHEAAHIRYSDFSLDFGSSVLRRRLSGAIEDVRIEYALAKDFPGTRLTLNTVIERLIAQGRFVANTATEHPANLLYGYVLKSLRARVLGQTALDPLVVQTEQALQATFPGHAIDRLQALLSEVPDGLSSEADCLALTDRILAMLQSALEHPTQPPSSTSEIEDRQHDEDQDEADQAKATNAETAEDEAHTETDDQTEQTVLSPILEAIGDGHAGVSGRSDVVEVEAVAENGDRTDGVLAPHPVLDSLFNPSADDIDPDVFDTIKSALTLTQDSVGEQVMPAGDEPPLQELAGLALLHNVQRESVTLRAALQGWVQAQTLQRTQHSTRGRRIDSRRLPRLALGDPQVFQRRAVKAAPNTAIHLLVDKSDSMGYPIWDQQKNQTMTRLPIALEAALALALTLEGLPGVNPGVTAFPGQHDASVYRLLTHGQRVRQRAGAFALSAAGSTPMTEAIWFAAAALLRCQEPRKVLMVMTDGQPNDTLGTLAILQSCRDNGIETVGIGLGIEVSHLFAKSIVIHELQELRTRLFALSKTLLLAV